MRATRNGPIDTRRVEFSFSVVQVRLMMIGSKNLSCGTYTPGVSWSDLVPKYRSLGCDIAGGVQGGILFLASANMAVVWEERNPGVSAKN